MAHRSESQDRREVLTGSCCLSLLLTADVVATDAVAAFARRRYAMDPPPDACSGDQNLKKRVSSIRSVFTDGLVAE